MKAILISHWSSFGFGAISCQMSRAVSAPVSGFIRSRRAAFCCQPAPVGPLVYDAEAYHPLLCLAAEASVAGEIRQGLEDVRTCRSLPTRWVFDEICGGYGILPSD
jgi:hypothetical protein